MSNVRYYSEEGLKKLKDELEHMIGVERPAISQMIAEARDKGDLSENAEYDAAKQAQGMLELKINNLQAVIRDARVVDESKIDTSKVSILSTVKIKNTNNKAVVSYTIVSEDTADVRSGKISVNSPIAKGLLGKKIGDTAEIMVPAGKMNFEIIDISR
jgi:transcription elongation factor GreA